MDQQEKKYCTDCGCDYDRHIEGILCDVHNCSFNDGQNKCCAREIKVGPREANCSADTACATFEPKAY